MISTKFRAFDGGVAMRGLILAAVVFGAVSGAQAADMPDFLRGSISAPTPTRNWDGWYAGGEVSYSAVSSDFSKSVVGLTNFIFRDSVLQQPTSQFNLLAKTTTQGTGFGAFVGRNWQSEDLVFGVEANYSYFDRLATSTSGSNSLLITNPPGTVNAPGITTIYGVTLTGRSAVQIKDQITFRGRAGWATGNFLPYVFGGVAIGRMDVSRSVTSNVTKREDTTTTDIFGNTVTTTGPTLPVPAQSQTLSEQRTNAFVAGWTGGLGLEYMLWDSVFLRGEWEYVKFLTVKNTAVQANNLRAGIGYKF
ncbi:MAG TPA: outer membrane beta-barrel protein [Bradyrhizobium sp.]|jgi:opacity protein-like surface antigen|nr:outer membrane beta-barrel protein [Bradyrhizobium sp.]